VTTNYKIFNKTNILFALFLILEFSLPSVDKAYGIHTTMFVGIMQLLFWMRVFILKDVRKAIVLGDIVFLVLLFVLAWELAAAKFGVLNRFLYPTPGEVIKLFIAEIPDLISAFLSSITILAAGYLLGAAVGIALGLIVGWNRRLYDIAQPITKMLAAIPPIVYIPYAIAIFPTFKLSSIFVIFIGSFWPIFTNTLSGVLDLDRKIIDSARAINVSNKNMLLHIILPGTIPSIMSGATIGLLFSFILLTSAEMIGATNGMGWYVKYFSDFADYKRVIIGIVFMGIVVSCIKFFFEKLEKYLLRWR